MATTLRANDLAQARQLADIITHGVHTLEALSRNAEELRLEREREAILKITSAATQLNALVRPPAHVLLDVTTGFALSAALRFVVEANVPEVIRTLTLSESLPTDKAQVLGAGKEYEHKLERQDQGGKPLEGIPVSAIANLCNVQASKLERILRILATHHIFVEVPPSRLPSPDGNNTEARFANNRLSEAIDSGARLEDIFDLDPAYLGVEDDVEIEDDSGCFLDSGPASVSKSDSAGPTVGKRKRECLDTSSELGADARDGKGGKKKERQKEEEKESKIGSRRPSPKERKSDKGSGFRVEEGKHEELKELGRKRLKRCEEIERNARWAAKYGSTEPGAGLAALVGLLTDESMSHATALTEVLLSSSPDPDSPRNAPFSRARAHDLPVKEMTMFDWLALPENAHRLHRFGCAMHGMVVLTGAGGSNNNSSEDGILKGFDFSALAPGSTIVDVGGGVGAASLPILRAYPHLNLNLVVQDTEETIANAPAFWETHLPSALHSGRVAFQAQDFFDPQPQFSSPPPPPDVFLLRAVMHNWSDAPSLKILSNLRSAAGAGTKLILVDSVLMRACREPEPEVGEHKGDGESRFRTKAKEAPEPLLANWGTANGLAYRLDLIMLANHNASERTLAQFDALLAAAGWTIKEVHRGANASESWMPQIVAVPAPLPSPATALGPVG